MDTLFFAENYELRKLAEVTINVTIIGVLILCQALLPIHASSMKVAKVTAPDFDTGSAKVKLFDRINPEIKKKNFDEKIRIQYPNATIKDIAEGVKHVRMTAVAL